MKVDEPKPVEPMALPARQAKTIDAAEHDGRRDRGVPGFETVEPPAEDRDTPEDIAAFHGLSGADLTDRARIAMMQLIEEIAELRQELTRNRKRMAFLAEQADLDPLSTVLNRRAFVRELTHAQLLGREFGAGNALVFLTLENLVAIVERHGRAAGDAAIEHVAGLLRVHVGAGNVVGRLDGGEFGVVLLRSGAEQARDRARRLAGLLEGRPLTWRQGRISLRVGAAVHGLRAEEEAEEALGAPERDHPVGRDDEGAS